MIKKVVSFSMALLIAVSLSSVVFAAPQLTIGGTSTPPNIDGKLTAEEWGEKLFTVIKDAPEVIIQGENADKFSADVYARYDSKNLYIGAVATYDEHKNDAATEAIWQEDCLQLCVSPDWDQASTLRNELGFALATDLKTQKATAWFSVIKTGTFEEANYKITRVGKETVYEIALPWSSVSTEGTFAEGKKIAFSVAFTMGRNGNFAAAEYAKGIVASKDASNAAEATLGAIPAAEAPQETKNPTTGDFSALGYMLTAGAALVTGAAACKRTRK